VCRSFKIKDELDDCITSLQSLDAILVTLRAELAELSDVAETDSSRTPIKADSAAQRKIKAPDYSDLLISLDVKKARRLVVARENAIKSVKVMLARKKGVSL
jgi:hypothetical protein